MKKYSLLIIGLFIVIELSLRAGFGLGHPPLYNSSSVYEYMQKPNQHLRRFGNLYITNEYSMRNNGLKDNAKEILFLGDSVINGGVLTDHYELATSIIQDSLNSLSYQSFQVLNISAGSWGPDNAVSYLEKHGNFDAAVIVAIFSSHDAGDTMTFEPIVGEHHSFPERKPLLATVELLDRYIFPRLKNAVESSVNRLKWNEESKKSKMEITVSSLNPGWNQLVEYCEKNSIPLFIYLHADRSEMLDKEYNENGQKIIQFLEKKNIIYFKGLNLLTREEYYRDGIHINSSGQKEMAYFFIPILKDSILARN
jgi:hypothetical protein